MRKWFIVVSLAFGLCAVSGIPVSAQSLSFTDITDIAGMNNSGEGGHGVMTGDVNGDNLVDVYITRNLFPGVLCNLLYINHGGVFTEEGVRRGVAHCSYGVHGGAFADLDNDRDLDLVIGVTYAEDGGGAPNRLFRNNGNGFFSDATPPAFYQRSEPTRAILASDLNRDGLLDIVAISGWLGSDDPPGECNEIYLNQGGLRFALINASALYCGPAGQGATDTDYDNDGDIDVFSANRTGPLNIFQNENGQNMTQVPPSQRGIGHRVYSGITFRDIDNDGDQDMALADPDTRSIYIYRNIGNGSFNFAGSIDGVRSYTVAFGDFNSDGYQDMAAAGHPFVLLNDRTGNFRQGPAVPGATSAVDPRAIAIADIENDGDLDFVTSDKRGSTRLFRNNLNQGNWIKIRLTSPQRQAGAFGAKVWVKNSATGRLLGYQEAQSNFGYLAQSSPVLQFGLGDETNVVIEVRFLDGARDSKQANANQVVDLGSPVCANPEAPSDLTFAVSGRNVTLNWPAGSGNPESYIIEAGSGNGLVDLAILATGSDPRFEAIAPPGRYFVRVRSRNACSTSGPSKEVIIEVR